MCTEPISGIQYSDQPSGETHYTPGEPSSQAKTFPAAPLWGGTQKPCPHGKVISVRRYWVPAQFLETGRPIADTS